MAKPKKQTAEQAAGLVTTPHPKTPRQPREKPMKVLCLGLSRTGTMSTYLALNKLGINSYHYLECMRNNDNGSTRRWKEAIEAKYFHGDQGKKLVTAEDFDQLLWRYQAVTDIPCMLFADELLAAYPDAKVILTERDEDGWVRSVQNSLYRIVSWRVWSILQIIDRDFSALFIPVYHYALRVWTRDDEYNIGALREGYRRNNQHIRDVVPKEKLLLFHPRNGWEPMCKFLGKEVPAEAFPHINEGEYVADIHWKVVVPIRFLVVTIGFVKKTSPLWVMGLGWWAYQHWGKS